MCVIYNALKQSNNSTITKAAATLNHVQKSNKYHFCTYVEQRKRLLSRLGVKYIHQYLKYKYKYCSLRVYLKYKYKYVFAFNNFTFNHSCYIYFQSQLLHLINISCSNVLSHKQHLSTCIVYYKANTVSMMHRHLAFHVFKYLRTSEIHYAKVFFKYK